MTEKLLFTIENNKIAELFGLQNFASKEVAVLELVKNSYDAGATKVEITISNDRLIIQDNGFGMTREIVKGKWMSVGVSNKQYNFLSIDKKERIYSGSKGIGRFALARLGSSIDLMTKSIDSNGVRWRTDWNENLLDDCDIESTGTTITISGLHDNWNLNQTLRLVDYLSLHKNCSDLLIIINYGDESFECGNALDKIALGVNALSSISFEMDSARCVLSVSINSCEFDNRAQIAIDNFNSDPEHAKRIITRDITKYTKEIDLLENLSFDSSLSEEEPKNRISNIGSFKGELFFNNNYNKKGAEDFYYVWPKTVVDFPRGTDGLFIFRNAFCISGYDGTEDWINLRRRVRLSPAAATHKSGRWRVRDNQISGAIYIDKQKNSNIVELQNRQGIEENESFYLFKQIIELALDIFEEFRQFIVRIVDERNKRIVPSGNYKEKRTVESFLKNPGIIHKYSEQQMTMFVEGVKTYKEDLEKEKTDYEQKRENLDYANRLLNSLSTIGLKSASIAHELNNKRNNIASSYDFIVNSLKEYGFWDILSDNNHTKQKASSVPHLLLDVRDVNDIIVNYIDSMLDNIDKSKFKKSVIDVKNVILDICNRWKNEYSWVNFNIDIDEEISFYSTIDVLNTIFDNLILNSIQQNNESNHLDILISCNQSNHFLLFTYHDNGVGLTGKYKKAPFKILEPHESSRENGHGLGMWILYSTVLNNNGEVSNIDGDNGFTINFSLEELKDGTN